MNVEFRRSLLLKWVWSAGHLLARATENASLDCDGGPGPHSGERIGSRSLASFAAEL